MTLLTAEELAGAHPYLAKSWPDWKQSMAGIQNRGGPWKCPRCGGPSYLCYRCSKCGADLVESG